jgi:tetratricopeptide (TPR) repeat protein
MPGRFSNLEFRSDQPDQAETTPILHKHSRTQSAADLLNQAHNEFQWGRFEPALRLYTRALKEQRNLIPAWVGQVQMLVQLDECHEARVWSDKGLELYQKNGELLAAKSQACIRLRDTKAAMAASDASLSSPGSSPWRWIARGEVLLARGHKLAAECFQKAVTEPAATWFEEIMIACTYLYYSRAANALSHARRATELEPVHGYPWLITGLCQQELGMLTIAEESFQRCLSLCEECEAASDALADLARCDDLLTNLKRLLFGWMRR